MRLLLDPQENEQQGGNTPAVVETPASASESSSAPAQSAPAGGETQGGSVPGNDKSDEQSFDLDALREGKDFKDIVSKGSKSTVVPAINTTPPVTAQSTPVVPASPPAAPAAAAQPVAQTSKINPVGPPQQFVQQQQTPVLSRDEALKDFDDATKSVLKKLPNDQFNFVVPQLKAARVAQQQAAVLQQQLAAVQQQGGQTHQQPLPTNWYEHPKAYELHPAYQQAVGTKQQMRSEYDYWQQQLIKIEKGQKWVDLEQTSDGKWTRVEKEPTIESKYAVEGYRNQAQLLVNQADSQIQGLAQQFQRGHQQIVTGIRQAEKEYFPDYVEQQEKHPSWDNVKGFYQYLHKRGVGDNPLAPILSMMYGRLTEYQNAYKTAISQQQTQQSVAQDQRLAGPSSGAIVAAGQGLGGRDDAVLDVNMWKNR